MLDLVSGGGMRVETFECPVCGARESYGIERLPDPDRLRERSEQLEQLAEDVESSELATRIEASL
jgi:hypothetical protein